VSGNRPARVAAEIQRTIAALLMRGGLKDPRVGMVTITGAGVTADLREAKVFWTSHGTEEEQKATAAGLEAAKGYLRRELGRSLGLRVTPELRFKYDEAIDRGERIEALLREVRQHEAEREPTPPADPKSDPT
jgi:ribosome-binding factor A